MLVLILSTKSVFSFIWKNEDCKPKIKEGKNLSSFNIESTSPTLYENTGFKTLYYVAASWILAAKLMV